MKRKTVTHPLPLVVSVENQYAIRRLLIVLALAPAFLLLTPSAHAQEGVATSEWQRIHDGLKAAQPMPDPVITLPSDSPTASGGLIQSDLKTLERTGIPSAIPGTLSAVGHIAGYPGIAPNRLTGIRMCRFSRSLRRAPARLVELAARRTLSSPRLSHT